MRICVIFLALALSGCGSMHFTKPGAGNTELKRDWTDCQAKMGQSGLSLYGGIPQQRSFMQTCMEGQGWERTD